MKTKLTIIIIGLTICGAMAAGLLWIVRGDQPDEAADERIEALQAELKKLRQAQQGNGQLDRAMTVLVGNRIRRESREARAAVLAPEKASPKTTSQAAPPAEPVSAEEAERQLVARMEQRFISQTPDPSRAQANLQRLNRSFARAKLPGSLKLGKVDCRGTMCAVDLHLDAGKDLQQQLSSVVDGWLMFGQPCGFHAPGPDQLDRSSNTARPRIYLDCPAS